MLTREIAIRSFGGIDAIGAQSDRFDRIYISKKRNPNWNITNISMIATEAFKVEDSDVAIFLSDHYGLSLTISFL